MAEAPKPVAGTPEYRDGVISFRGSQHPGLDAAHTKVKETRAALKGKIANTPELSTKWDELQTSITNDKLSRRDALVKVEEFHSTHLPEESKAFKAARNDVRVARGELHAEHMNALGKLETLPGATKEQLAEAAKKFDSQTTTRHKVLDRIVNPSVYKNNFSILREQGVGAALKNSVFSAEAWTQRTGKTAIKSAGALVGIGAIVDATMRSEKTGPDGKPIERSWVARLAEAGAGAALTAGSLLHGGR